MDAHDPSNKIENWKSIQLMDVPNGCGTKLNELNQPNHIPLGFVVEY